VTLEEARSELELTSRASAADVRRAFKKLALLYHPDRDQGKLP
jgi:DnaJ-class molecular chaperone